jgi:hypothetical protein
VQKRSHVRLESESNKNINKYYAGKYVGTKFKLKEPQNNIKTEDKLSKIGKI